MFNELITSAEAFLTLVAVISVIVGVITRYIIKPHRDNKKAESKALRDDIMNYRKQNADVLTRIEGKIDRIEDDQRANHVCAKEHTRELKQIKYDMTRGRDVMDDIKNRGVDTSKRLSKLEGRIDEHLRKT